MTLKPLVLSHLSVLLHIINLEGNVEPVTWFKQLVYLTVVIGRGEIGEIKHRLKWWLHT